MSTPQILTSRASAALQRLAALQKRAERVAGASEPVLRSAMKELAGALEDLKGASDHLHRQADELDDLRGRTAAMVDRFNEFAEVLPIPCVWTNAEGEIDAANTVAADFLNVSLPHLAGRSLMLFVSDRQKFMDANAALVALVDRVEFVSVVRPRERRPRPVRLLGRRMQNDTRVIWFLLDSAAD